MLDRTRLRIYPLAERENRVTISSVAADPDAEPPQIDAAADRLVDELAGRIREAREQGRPRIIAFGAHTIKNGAGPLLIRLMEEQWVTLLATNGAGIIHDWEFAFLGESSEHVRANVAAGRFGLWEETGRSINLALALGAYRGLGYGASVGAMIAEQGLTIPSPEELLDATAEARRNPARAAAAADLLDVIDRAGIRPGRLEVAHPHASVSVQAAAWMNGLPFTGHPMVGHDIIYTHPLNLGAAVGRTAERDFLRFADEISRIDGGVYLSVGSAVMSPMVFEKSLSMAMNLALQEGRVIKDHHICVVDLAASSWDWSRGGEPPPDNPAYYVRFMKTFSRMGGTTTYLQGDNRTVLAHLCRRLCRRSDGP